jgi:CubicO group peptidase (beta-lactamase class C family)
MTKVIIFNLAIAVFCLTIISCSGSKESMNLQPKEKAQRFLDEVISGSESPAVQYVIVTADSVLFEYSTGLSDIKNKTQIQSYNTLNAFSVTKTFTALAILQLQEQGRLNINDKISLYLDFYPYDKEITIKQVLNHTAGIPNPLPLNWAHLEGDSSFNYSEFVKQVIKENNQLDNKPGEKYSYSNLGYLLLGEVIKKTSGDDYTTYIENNIINTLNLKDGEYLGFSIPEGSKHSHGYIKKWSLMNFVLNFIFDKNKFIEESYDGWSQFRNFYVDGLAYGGLVGNARGFSKYLQALLNENVLISESSKEQMFGTQVTNRNKKIDMTLSWFSGSLNDTKFYTHAGGGGGYYCEIRLYPDKKMASVIMFNRTGVSKENYLNDIDVFFLDSNNNSLIVNR